MPHSDAASIKHPRLQTIQGACTGCRIGVRHDSFRPIGLYQVVVHRQAELCMAFKLPPFGRVGVGVPKAVFRLPKGRLLQRERRPFTLQEAAFRRSPCHGAFGRWTRRAVRAAKGGAGVRARLKWRFT